MENLFLISRNLRKKKTKKNGLKTPNITVNKKNNVSYIKLIVAPKILDEIA